MKKKKKEFEPDPDIGKPCLICGAPYHYRITLKCDKCRKKTIITCQTPDQAWATEKQLADGAPHKDCGGKFKSRRWRTHEHHHVSYREDKTVLLCYCCHQRLHGNARITHHPFKKTYAKDIEPFVFAAHVTRLYIDALPDLVVEGPEPERRELTKVEKKLNTTTH